MRTILRPRLTRYWSSVKAVDTDSHISIEFDGIRLYFSSKVRALFTINESTPPLHNGEYIMVRTRVI